MSRLQIRHILVATALLAVAPTTSPGQHLGETNRPVSFATNLGPVAIVLGKTIGPDQRGIALPIILNSILDKFAAENKLTVEEADINALLNAMRQKRIEGILNLENKRKGLEREMASPVLSEEGKAKKAKELEKIEKLLKVARDAATKADGPGADPKKEREMAAERILKWKSNQALFRKYGGRVIGPVREPESFDGKKTYFMEQSAAGSFKIFDKKLEGFFWNVLTNEVLYARLFVAEGDRERVMSSPWWLAGQQLSNNVSPTAGEVKSDGKQTESSK